MFRTESENLLFFCRKGKKQEAFLDAAYGIFISFAVVRNGMYLAEAFSVIILLF
jgi:hypothetical protein